MKKSLLAPVAVALFAFTISCKKEIATLPNNAGISNEAGVERIAAQTYLPLTEGTYWKYDMTEDDGSEKNSILTVLGEQKSINSKVYEKINLKQGKKENELYYTKQGNDYFMYTEDNTSEDQEIKLEVLFLKDDAAVGATWETNAGTANGLSAKCKGKILEKGISRKVSGTTYKNVIHTQVEIYVKVFWFDVKASVQDFYVARGIGIIENTVQVIYGDASTTTSKLSDYKIKPVK